MSERVFDYGEEFEPKRLYDTIRPLPHQYYLLYYTMALLISEPQLTILVKVSVVVVVVVVLMSHMNI